MKKNFTFFSLLLSFCAFGQSSVLIEPNGSNGIISKSTTPLTSDPGLVTLPISGDGTRLMWIPNKSAFRVGTIGISGTQWDASNIGTWSLASGFNTKASGSFSTAMGAITTASGYISTTIGNLTTASGAISTAMGNLTTASGAISTAIGYETNAIGDFSISMGANTTASGDAAVAMGSNTTAQAQLALVLGRYNIISGTTDNWIATDPLFVAGNGFNNANRNNALTLLKNSNLGLNTATPQYQLTFKDDLGDKISLFGGNTTNTSNHYGMGIQSAKFQIFTPTDFDDVVFGYGRSAAFTENVRFKGTGLVGIGVPNPSEFLDVNGRMRVRHRPNNTAGVWMSNSLNSTALGDGAFYGMKTDTEAGIFIGGAWRFGVTNTGVVSATGGISVGGGETISKIKKTIYTYDIPSIPANSSFNAIFPIGDLNGFDNIIVNPRGSIFPLIISYTRYVSSTNMEIVFYNPSNSSINIGIIDFNITVIK